MTENHATTRATYAGHGRPAKICYHGRFGNDPAMILATRTVGQGTVVLSDPITGKAITSFGSRTLFWAHPAEETPAEPVTPTDHANQVAASVRKALEEAKHATTPTPAPPRWATRTDRPANPVVFSVPAEPRQEFRCPDVWVHQLLALVDAGAQFQLHSDGYWRDATGSTASLLDTVALRLAIEEAVRVGVAYIIGEPEDRVKASPIHQALHPTGSSAKPVMPLCVRDVVYPLIRFRLTDRTELVDCKWCRESIAEAKTKAQKQEEALFARGVRPDAVVTVGRGARRWTVLELQEDMVHLDPHLTDAEAASGATPGTRWISASLVRVVHPAGGR